jgi:S-adenosylmethionine:tRNA ribosyltransferase-isomerase
LLDQLNQKGIDIAYLTLHVGYGTFAPVRVEDIRQHKIHTEWFHLDTHAAAAINKTKAQGNRVVAVGTTTVRTLEYCVTDEGGIEPQSGMCDLFIYPGHKFKSVDAMITNFHLPQSTLMMLVSAFAGRENIMNAYAEAVDQKYRFFSYGDAMLIL